MTAIPETTEAKGQTLPDLRESLCEHHRVGGKLWAVESGSVGHQGGGNREQGEGIRGRQLRLHCKQLHMAGGVAATLQPSGDGRDP
jgi:hypothetical protein